MYLKSILSGEYKKNGVKQTIYEGKAVVVVADDDDGGGGSVKGGGARGGTATGTERRDSRHYRRGQLGRRCLRHRQAWTIDRYQGRGEGR